MNRSTVLAACAALLLAAQAQAATGLQEVITPAQYFECQIAAQQATVLGLEEQAKLIAAKAGDEARRQSSESARQRVTLALYGCGRQNASTLGAYAYRNADALQDWLQANPQVKARLDALSKRVAVLSAQMPAPTPSR